MFNRPHGPVEITKYPNTHFTKTYQGEHVETGLTN